MPNRCLYGPLFNSLFCDSLLIRPQFHILIQSFPDPIFAGSLFKSYIDPVSHFLCNILSSRYMKIILHSDVHNSTSSLDLSVLKVA